jgi:hypothetical protein
MHLQPGRLPIGDVLAIGWKLLQEALLNIAVTTIENITEFENNQPLEKLAG